MKFKDLRIARLAIGVFSAVGVAAVLWGQQADGPGQGVALVTDWSHHHLLYSEPSGSDLPSALRQEPRYWQQRLRHYGKQSPTHERITEDERRRPAKPRNKFKRDWAMSLGPGAIVGAGQFPAKFSFDVTTASCSGDFVAFNTGVPGSATQASIVAFGNLYSGCSGTVPATYWAYKERNGALR